jgi:CheY-like chemotaxis protein
MSDTVTIAIIGAIVVLVIFLVSVFAFRDRIQSIQGGPQGITITLADKQAARANLQMAEQTRGQADSDAKPEPERTTRSMRTAEDKISGLTQKLQKTILWVDDHPSNNDYEVKALKPLGVDVIQVRSNDEAYSAIEKSRPALVVTDIGRDREPTDGMDLTETVAKRWPDLPVLIYTSTRSLASKKDEALRRGAKGITAYPSELINMVIENLR